LTNNSTDRLPGQHHLSGHAQGCGHRHGRLPAACSRGKPQKDSRARRRGPVSFAGWRLCRHLRARLSATASTLCRQPRRQQGAASRSRAGRMSWDRRTPRCVARRRARANGRSSAASSTSSFGRTSMLHKVIRGYPYRTGAMRDAEYGFPRKRGCDFPRPESFLGLRPLKFGSFLRDSAKNSASAMVEVDQHAQPRRPNSYPRIPPLLPPLTPSCHRFLAPYGSYCKLIGAPSINNAPSSGRRRCSSVLCSSSPGTP
jgi:hypothetical protein